MKKYFLKFKPYSDTEFIDFSSRQNKFHKENQGKIFITVHNPLNYDEFKIKNSNDTFIDGFETAQFSIKRFDILKNMSFISLPDELFKF